MRRRRLDFMPFDKVFETKNGSEELCHATGDEVRFDGDMEWWNEYVDTDGNFHYGR